MRWGRRSTTPSRTRTQRSAQAAQSGELDNEVDAVPATPIERPERIIMLTDGIVAIAITLLVLDLNAIDYRGSSAEELWHQLRDESGRFVAFFIAFWVIAQFWMAHHLVFQRITRHEDTLAMRNFWFLFGISVLPFTTTLLGETTDNPLPVTLFSVNLLLINLSLNWVAMGARRIGAIAAPTDERHETLTRARAVTTAVLYIVPAVLAWIIRPNSAELFFLLFYLTNLPGRLIVLRRERRERRPVDQAALATGPPRS